MTLTDTDAGPTVSAADASTSEGTASNPVNASIADGIAVGTIVDDDTDSVTLSFRAMDTSVNEGAGTVAISVKLESDSPLTTAVTVDFQTAIATQAVGQAAAGQDYAQTSGTLTFAPGVTQMTITVPVTSDDIDELNEEFEVRLSNPGGAILKSPSVHIVRIIDDEPTAAFVTSTSSGSEGSTPRIAVTLVATSVLTSPMSVTFSTNAIAGSAIPGSDYVEATGTLTFPQGSENGAVQYAEVSLLRDRIFEAHETFGVILRSAAGIALALHNVTIANDPTVPGDLEGDGQVDLIWQNRLTGALGAWFMDGTVHRHNASLTPDQVGDNNWHIVGRGDVNQDGWTDLYWQHQTTGALYVWTMNGTTLASSDPLTPSSVVDLNWKVRTVADMDRDGHPDLVWQHIGDGSLAVWFMNGRQLRPGGGELLAPGQVADLKWRIAAAGDVNRDGFPDLFWHHEQTGQLAVWLMRGRVLSSGLSLSPDRVSDINWQLRGADDLDGNGYPDLIWQNTSTLQLSAWLLVQQTLIDGRLIVGPTVPDASWWIVGPK
jgi:hypothetical protein